MPLSVRRHTRVSCIVSRVIVTHSYPGCRQAAVPRRARRPRDQEALLRLERELGVDPRWEHVPARRAEAREPRGLGGAEAALGRAVQRGQQQADPAAAARGGVVPRWDGADHGGGRRGVEGRG